MKTETMFGKKMRSTMSHLLIAAAMFTGASLLNGQSMLVNKGGNNLCLAVRDGKIANDSTLMLWDCLTGDPSQIFVFDSARGLLRIGSANSQYCVASYDGAQRGARVGVWQCQIGANGRADPSQFFILGSNGGNIMSSGGLCPGVMNANMARGTPIILWDCGNPAPNQTWTFRPVSAPTPAALPPSLAPAPLSLTIPPGSFLSHNGSALISGLDAQGHLLDANRQPMAAGGANNYFLSVVNGQLVAQGGGNYTASLNGVLMLVAQGGGNYNGILVNGAGVPYRLVSQGGGNLQMYNGGALVAQGGGNLVAQGGGNIVGNGNLVAQGGGNFVAAEVNYAAQVAHVISTNGSNLLARDGGSFTDPGYLTRIIPSSIMVNNGGNFGAIRSLQSVPATPAPAANSGVCRDTGVTNAIRAVLGRAPNGSGDTGECASTRYGGGQWINYTDLVLKVGDAFGWPRGKCNDRWIIMATLDVRGVLPAGTGTTGQCDPRDYAGGHWNSYNGPQAPSLIQGVKAYYGLR